MSDEESRTASVGSKRRARIENERELTASSGEGTPRKKAKVTSLSHNLRDLPRGGTFGTLPPQLSGSCKTMDPIEVSDGSASEHESHNTNGASRVPTMNWNKGTNTAIRTSLGGNSGALGKSLAPSHQAPLPQAPIRFEIDEEEEEESSEKQDMSSEESGEVPDSDEDGDDFPTDSREDPINISDDSDVSSVDEGGILLNMDTRQTETASKPLSISDNDADHEQGEIVETASPKVRGGSEELFQIDTRPSVSAVPAEPNGFISSQLDGPSESGAVKNMAKLCDLSGEDLQEQLEYAYYHIPRDQLDLDNPVICLFCFESGHLASVCGLKYCDHCGARDEHKAQNCPQYRRCLKCRERGHDAEQCPSKLKDTSVPCDLCGLSDHVEDTCPSIWMYSGPEPRGPFSLNICCCNCASKTHLVGDCPLIGNRPNKNLRSWSLRSIDPSHIINLTLRPETQQAEATVNSFGPKPDFRVRGRADRYGGSSRRDEYIPSSDEDEDNFFRPPVNKFGPPRHIRFGDSSNSRHENDHGFNSDKYRPAPPSSYRDRQDNPFDYRRPRSRSRSPPRSGYGRRNGRPPGTSDSWNPPLPPGPPPGGRQGKGRGGESYRPIPSAGKKNWDRYRFGG